MATAGLLTWPTLVAYAHGESIDVTLLEAKPGDSIAINGAEFPLGEEVELSLEGVRGSVPLGHAEVNESGGLSTTVVIPESASAGSNQLVANTEDDTLTIDFAVLEGDTASSSKSSTELVFQRSLGGTALVLVGNRRHA